MAEEKSEEKPRSWSSPGYLWKDGSVPRCAYCGKYWTEIDCPDWHTEKMMTCYYSGRHFCNAGDHEECRKEHGTYMLDSANEIVETTEHGWKRKPDRRCHE
tara:strand:+ start:1116 stop:1418 length:303 start_codon:yes stop_codon:yes gene_type:complete